jgi:hypothetical protein
LLALLALQLFNSGCAAICEDRREVLTATGAVSEAEPLRDDAFAAELAGLLEDDGAVAAEMLRHALRNRNKNKNY